MATGLGTDICRIGEAMMCPPGVVTYNRLSVVSPAAVVETLEDRPGGTEMFVVVKVFPFLSLLWAGLLLVLFGSGWIAFFRRRAPV